MWKQRAEFERKNSIEAGRQGALERGQERLASRPCTRTSLCAKDFEKIKELKKRISRRNTHRVQWIRLAEHSRCPVLFEIFDSGRNLKYPPYFWFLILFWCAAQPMRHIACTMMKNNFKKTRSWILVLKYIETLECPSYGESRRKSEEQQGPCMSRCSLLRGRFFIPKQNKMMY